MNIVAVCGSFHKSEIEQMLNYAKDEATKHSIEITKVIWVPGSMEVPLAIERSFSRHGSWFLIMVLSTTINFLMQAMRATLGIFP